MATAEKEYIEREAPSTNGISRLMSLFDEWGLSQYIPHHTEQAMLAAYLLANGVIATPCRRDQESLFAIVDLYNRKKIVGQTIAKYDIDHIIIGFSQKPIYCCCNASNEWMEFDGDEIGKNVFLTHEAAEKAIQEKEQQP